MSTPDYRTISALVSPAINKAITLEADTRPDVPGWWDYMFDEDGLSSAVLTILSSPYYTSADDEVMSQGGVVSGSIDSELSAAECLYARYHKDYTTDLEDDA